jgi:mannose-6-phosphate isomerase-like protein (cupin superfamily)
MDFKLEHSDERRTILANTELLNGKEISIIKLKKGKAIGGCIHKNDEYYAVISGCVVVTKGVENTVGMAGDGGTFYAGVPHAFFAEEDSIIMEWGISPEEKKADVKDKELLNKVKEWNLLR